MDFKLGGLGLNTEDNTALGWWVAQAGQGRQVTGAQVGSGAGQSQVVIRSDNRDTKPGIRQQTRLLLIRRYFTKCTHSN